MSRIFLSHSSTNNAAALALGSWLEARGWSDYFLDVDESRGIVPGERWMAALAGAVDRCEAVIFLVSPAWRASKYCFAEFYQAKNLGKRIFGVIVEPIALSQLPEQMTSEWQVCDLTTGGDTVSFTVERNPIVPETTVRFPRAGIEALARGLQKAGLAPSTFTWPPDGDPDRSPYPGLRALEEADAAVFFGREAAVVRAIDQIRVVRERDVEQLFVILGASGAGKSSFLRAGLLPRLRRDSEHFAVLPMIRPERAVISGSHGLLSSLQRSLATIGQSLSTAEIRKGLAEVGLAGMLRRIVSGAQSLGTEHQLTERTVVIPIDQAEELFASDGQDEAQQFLQWVNTLDWNCLPPQAEPVSRKLRVLFVMTLRSDSLPSLQGRAALQALSPVLFSLPAMPVSEFKAIIERPAERHNASVKPLVIDPQLTEELVADAQGADALPLLALTLEWLYREFTNDKGTHIGRGEYKCLGGVRGVIGKAVERAFERPSNEPAIPVERSEQEHLLHLLFPHIATVDPDTGEWKRRFALRAAIREQVPQADALVSRLIEQRLLLADSRRMADGAAPVQVIEVAHEALLRQWEILERWLSEYAAELSATESIRRAASDWQRSECDEALLVHTAHRLQAAEALLADKRLTVRFGDEDVRYLSACRERDKRERQQREDQIKKIAEHQTARATLQRRVAWGLSGAAIGLLGLFAWIVLQAREIGQQTLFLLAGSTETAADQKHFEQSIRLGVLANKSSFLSPAHPTARPALTRAADGNTLRIMLTGHNGKVSSAAFSPDDLRIVTASEDETARIWDARTGRPVGEAMSHDKWVSIAAFSPDGQLIITASEDNTARVWDGYTGKPMSIPMSHGDGVVSASFSPDGKLIVTASRDKTARVWVSSTGMPVGVAMKHGEWVADAVFSPDSQYIVTASRDKSARIWDAHTGKPLGKAMMHDGAVTSAAFSTDGKRIVTASEDGAARVWDAKTGKRVGKAMPHGAPVFSAAFNPDGQRIVTAYSKSAHIWDTDTGEPVGEAMRHTKRIVSAVFSPDGRRVVTASEDNTARVWDATTGHSVGEVKMHGELVTSAAFSLDGQRIITASHDKSARVWDIDNGQIVSDVIRHDDLVSSAAFSSDGQRIVTASMDNTSRVWDTYTGKPMSAPMRHSDGVDSAAFSPDGKLIVTASRDNTARIWDSITGQPIGEMMSHDAWVGSAAFSPDGQRIVTASKDKTARIWDAHTGHPVGEVMKHGEWVRTAAFSPDGQRIVTASWDKTARVWDATTGTPMGDAIIHAEWVESAAFSPDGQRVVTASLDKTARVWDAKTGQPVGKAMRHNGVLTSAVFSPDGQSIVTASDDKTARVWDAKTCKPVGELMTHGERVSFAAFSPDGQRIVTASDDKTARVWDAKTGKPVGEPMMHDGVVYSAVFSPDGQRVVTASWDDTARVWRGSWSLIDSTEALIQASCGQMNIDARRITYEDVALAKVISPQRVGEDVCDGMASTPLRRTSITEAAHPR